MLVWNLPTYREDNRARESENRVPRRIFGPKRNLGTRNKENLHNRQVHDLYSSPDFTAVISQHGQGIWQTAC
jgi:hypothetical protein